MKKFKGKDFEDWPLEEESSKCIQKIRCSTVNEVIKEWTILIGKTGEIQIYDGAAQEVIWTERLEDIFGSLMEHDYSFDKEKKQWVKYLRNLADLIEKSQS